MVMAFVAENKALSSKFIIVYRKACNMENCAIKGKGTILVLCIALFLSLFLSQNLPAEVNRVIHDTGSVSYDNSQLDKAAFTRKTKKLQMPFIANNGQMDEQVAFYAKTFGGTVFVTKAGEIVYALPEGRGREVPAGASSFQESAGGAWERRSSGADGWHGQAPLVGADAEYEFVVANAYSPLFRSDNANCPPDRVLANALVSAYLPGLQRRAAGVSTSMQPITIRIPKSKIRNPPTGIALKETIVGAKVVNITGEQPAVTTLITSRAMTNRNGRQTSHPITW